MQNFCKSLFLIFSLCPITAYSQMELSSPGSAVTTSASLDVASAYVFRGQTLNKGSVLQPALSIESTNGLAVGVWGNMDIDKNEANTEGGQFSEIDINISYNLPLPTEMMEIKLGAREYTYPGAVVATPDDSASDREMMMVVSARTPFSPTASVHYGTQGSMKRDIYSEFSVNEELWSQGDLDLSAALIAGYVDHDSEDLKDGMTHGMVSLAAAYGISNVSINQLVETDKKVNPLAKQETFYVTIGAANTF
jgi:hypothetical protein